MAIPRKKKLALARKMRAHPSPPEAIMWRLLSRSQLGVAFQRQTILAGYIVDFYAPKLHLAVEVDGSQHIATPEAIAYDKHRDAVLAQHGVKVVRIPAKEVFARPFICRALIAQHVATGLRNLEGAIDSTSGGASSVDGGTNAPSSKKGSR